MAYIEIDTDVKGEHRFRVRGDNHEIMASGEGYKTLQSCEHAIKVLKAELPSAEVRYHQPRGLFGGSLSRRFSAAPNALTGLMTNPK